jgi:hypothetical protein
MAYDITGKVKVIQEAQTFASGFTKRELVVTVEDGKYPQDINIEFMKDQVALLDSVNEGDIVTVAFNLRGREYNGRYFNNLAGWKINVDSAGASDAPNIPGVGEGAASAPPEFDSEIPF